MTITIDHDNDCIRMKYRDTKIEDDKNIPITGQMHQIENLIKEMIEMICDGNDHPPISILKQDDGNITTIEEY